MHLHYLYEFKKFVHSKGIKTLDNSFVTDFEQIYNDNSNISVDEFDTLWNYHYSEVLSDHAETSEKLINNYKRQFQEVCCGMDEFVMAKDFIGNNLQYYAYMSDFDKFENEAKNYWFNFNIKRESNSKYKELKYMPYESYLKTHHWKKVRAAMIFIEKGYCKDCGETYYGSDWVLDLEVHHLHYRNKGHERYKDLNLLCKIHHHQKHR